MARLRIAMTLSGAVSLGAFEGGALAAMLLGLQGLPEEDKRAVTIDAMGGASAGSMTALLSAWVLLQGADPIDLMEEAWVRGDAIDVLRAHDTSAPLSGDALRALGDRLFRPVEGGARRSRQRFPIRVAMALASLRGLSYKIPSLEQTTPVQAATYLDWKEVEFAADAPPETFTQPVGGSAVEFSLASGANALGFPPVLLDREGNRADYEAHGIENLPTEVDPDGTRHAYLWYTDGGTIDNEPMGRTIEVAAQMAELEDGETRLHLLIHPHPSAPPMDDAWANPKNPPTWTHTLTRAMHIGMTQSLYDDLREMEKTNSRLVWRDRLVDGLRQGLAGMDEKVTEALTRQLQAALSDIEGQRDQLRAQASRPAAAAPAAAGLSVEELLVKLINRVAGLTDKRPIFVEVISPLLVAQPGQRVEDLLAGEFMAHFGGFLDKELRMSDFVLGYQSMLEWMKEGWARHGLDDQAATIIQEAARAGVQGDWKDYHAGDKSLGSLGWGDRLAVARLVAHIAHVVEHDVRHWDQQ